MKEKLEDEEKSNWHPGEQGRLTKDEAHDEANMMRVKMKVSPETGLIKKPGLSYEDESRPTPEDYNYALKAIEQLKQAAADEPSYQKVLLQVLRVAARPMQEFFHALDAVSPLTIKGFNDLHEKRMHALDDAEKRLKVMQKSGENFGDAESAWHPDTREEK